MDLLKDKKMISGLALIIIAAAIFVLFDLTLWGEIKVNRDKLEKAEQDLVVAKDLLAVITEINTAFGDVAKEKERIEIALPPRAELPELLIQISSLASQNGLSLEQISFAANEKQLTGYVPINISVVVAGNYEALKTFLVAIEQNLRIIDVNGISFGTPKEEGKPISFSLRLTTYFQ